MNRMRNLAIVGAMLWALWRTSGRELVYRVLLMAVVIGFGFASDETVTGPERTVINGVFVMMLIFIGISSSTWWLELDREQKGYRFRLGFTRPVATWLLVAVPMIFTSVCGVLCYAAPALARGCFANSPMPMLGPMMFIAAGSACFMAATWSPSTIPAKLIGIVALVFSAAVIVETYHACSGVEDPILMAIGRPEYFPAGWQAALATAACLLVSLTFTIYAVGRQRCGERLWIESFVAGLLPRSKQAKSQANVASLTGFATKSGDTPNSFASRFSAQCWYESRRFGGKVLLLGLASALAVYAFAEICQRLNPEFEGGPYVWLLAICLCPFVYQLVGADGALGLRRKDGVVFFSKYDATRSMTNGQLIAIKLLVIAVSSLLGCFIMVAFAALHISVGPFADGWDKIRSAGAVVGEVPAGWWAVAGVTAMMTYIASTSLLLTLGFWVPLYPRRFFFLVCFAYAHFGIAMWDGRLGEFLRSLHVPYGYVLALAILVLSLFTIFKSVKSGHLSGRLFGAAVVLWGVYVASTVFLWTEAAPIVEIPTVIVVLACVSLIVPLAATAAAPLSLANHRHG